MPPACPSCLSLRALRGVIRGVDVHVGHFGELLYRLRQIVVGYANRRHCRFDCRDHDFGAGRGDLHQFVEVRLADAALYLRKVVQGLRFGKRLDLISSGAGRT
jgi:hypothetical protein